MACFFHIWICSVLVKFSRFHHLFAGITFVMTKCFRMEYLWFSTAHNPVLMLGILSKILLLVEILWIAQYLIRSLEQFGSKSSKTWGQLLSLNLRATTLFICCPNVEVLSLLIHVVIRLLMLHMEGCFGYALTQLLPFLIMCIASSNFHSCNYTCGILYMLYLSQIIQQSRNPIFASEMASSSSSALPPSSSDAIKPECFDGTGFKRWQARTRLWLMELGLYWVLTEEPPAPQGEAVLDEVERTRLDALRARWEKANASALARLLAVLSNRLFDVYVSFGEARKVWTELNDKYAESDNGNESFMVASYLNFRMGDGRSVMEQIHELQLIVRDLG